MSKTKISICVPYIISDETSYEVTKKSLKNILENSVTKPELVLIDNGSPELEKFDLWSIKKFDLVKQLQKVVNDTNVGVLQTFVQGYENSSNEIIVFLHNDVLIHEKGWDQRIVDAFDNDKQLGLAGLLGSRGVMPDGGRVGVMSHMIGKEWGKCPDPQPAALHHGELMTEVAPASMFDGVGLFFRRENLKQLIEETDCFSKSKAPHHFYDRDVTLQSIANGWHCAVIGIQFDHWSGVTANMSKQYHEFGSKWCKDNGLELIDGNADLTIYKKAEQDFFNKWSGKLPLFVEGDYQYNWNTR